MLASITPLGERARGASWAITTTMFIGAAVIGGAAIGALVGSLGVMVLSDVEIRWRLGLVVLVLAAGLVWEVAAGMVPGPRRQVNERWLDDFRRWVYAVGFGAQLGTGVATIVVSSAVYAVWVAALASASPATGVAIGAVAGSLRGATILASRGVVTPDRLIRFHSRMRSLQRPARRVLLTGQLALLGTAILVMVA
jgi:MFS family permease